DPEVFDPKFSWNPVAGAARYEVEINSSSDFALGSKVCCSGTTIATSLSPTSPMKDNVYYWRVRAFDPDGNAGVWNYGPSFTKTFDKTAPAGPVTGTAIKNLHMRDNVTNDTLTADADHNLANGYQTTVPVVSWDPVPGASSYEVQITGWNGTACTPVKMTVKTSVPAWTPLGSPSTNPAGSRYSGPASDFSPITPGQYCVRVSARADRGDFDEVFTGIAAYALSGSFDPASYPDETASYGWLVLPSTTLDGSSASPIDVAHSNDVDFQKQSTPPTLESPASGTAFFDQPRFGW